MGAIGASSECLGIVKCSVSSGLRRLQDLLGRWHTVCTIYGQLKYKIGFPGWPEPNLDWDSGFGGSVLEEGGLHQPPFSLTRSGKSFTAVSLPAGESSI